MIDQQSSHEPTSVPSPFRLDPADPYPIFARLRVQGAVLPLAMPAVYRRDGA